MALTNRVFQCNYTLVNMEKATIDIEQLENSLKPTLINTLKKNPDVRILPATPSNQHQLYNYLGSQHLTRSSLFGKVSGVHDFNLPRNKLNK